MNLRSDSGNKILIIDDEILTINYLKSFSCWNRYGFGEILHALTVTKALELFQREQPKLVFMDIRMPVKNGLELSREFLALLPNTNIVIMTAYQEFEYVKEAMEMGVNYFLTKHEICEEKIEELLDKIVSQISFRQKYENMLWNDWFRSIWEAKMADVSEVNSMLEPGKCYFVIMGILRGLPVMIEEEETIRLREEGIRELKLCNMKMKVFIKLDRFTYGILCEYHPSFSIAQNYGEIMNGMRLLQDFCCRETGLQSTLFISDMFMTEKALLQVIDKVKRFAGSVPVGRRNLILEETWEDYRLLKPEEFFPEKPWEEWRMGDLEEIVQKIRNGNGYLLWKNLDSLRKYIKNAGLQEYLKRQEKMKEIFDLSGLIQICLEEFRARERENQGNRIVEKAIDYIHIHYAEDISSSVIAEHQNVSEGYLRMIFKKEMNCTVKEYILRYRIEKARKLLLKDDRKIYDIAILCGFPNSQHFCRVFRQMTGKSPGEYKKNR